MSVTAEKTSFAGIAGEDLSGLQYRAIEVDGTLAANANVAAGILQNKPKSGEPATIAYMGQLKLRTGVAITVGQRLTITASGWAAVVVSGSGAQIGRALTVAASGGLVEGLFYFVNAHATVDNQ